MADIEQDGMTKSNRTLALEIRTILDMIVGLAGSKGGVIEDLSKDELIHYLNMARSRLDTLSCKLEQQNRSHISL